MTGNKGLQRMNLEVQIGLALVAIGLGMALRQLVRRIGMTQAKGNIVRVEALDPAPSGKAPARPGKITVRFTDTQGVVRFFTGKSRGEERRPGETIAILYRPSDPQGARIDSLAVWVTPLVLAAIGVFLAVKPYLFG